MKFMIPFLIAALPVASVVQSRSGVSSGVPSVAIPKTTEVLVIQTARQGVSEDPRRATSRYGNSTARETGIDGPSVRSGWTFDAVACPH